MNVSSTSNFLTLEQKDIKTFNNLIILFIVLKILTILIYLFRPIISAVASDLGTIFLLIGIYLLSKKYKQLKSGFKVVILFILSMVFDLIVAVLDNTYPHSYHSSSTSSTVLTQGLTDVSNSFGSHVYLIIFFAILAGIVTFFTTYFLTTWINIAFQYPRKLKMFLYFGICTLVGEFITSIGYFFFARAVDNLVSDGAITLDLIVRRLAISALIIVLGALLVIIGYVLEIVAGIMVYNRNKSFLNRPPNPVVSAEGISYCANCGKELETGAKICYNCGLAVER